MGSFPLTVPVTPMGYRVIRTPLIKHFKDSYWGGGGMTQGIGLRVEILNSESQFNGSGLSTRLAAL